MKVQYLSTDRFQSGKTFPYYTIFYYDEHFAFYIAFADDFVFFDTKITSGKKPGVLFDFEPSPTIKRYSIRKIFMNLKEELELLTK